MRLVYRIILFSGLLLSITSCATTSQKVSYYIIQPDNGLEPLALPLDSLSIAIGPAEFPTYLRRNQIVTRDNNRLSVNEYHRWGASFEKTVLSAVGENIRQLLNTTHVIVYPTLPRFALNYRLVMDIVQFDGKLGDEVTLNVRWMVLDKTGKIPLIVKQSKLTQHAEGTSYDDLVAVYGRLLASLSKEMADSVNSAMRQDT